TTRSVVVLAFTFSSSEVHFVQLAERFFIACSRFFTATIPHCSFDTPVSYKQRFANSPNKPSKVCPACFSFDSLSIAALIAPVTSEVDKCFIFSTPATITVYYSPLILPINACLSVLTTHAHAITNIFVGNDIRPTSLYTYT